MPTRILFLLTQDLQSPSGLGRYLPMASEMARKGFEVRIAALHSNFTSLDHRIQLRNGISIHYVAQMHVKKQGSEKQYYSPPELFLLVLLATWQLTRAALHFPADIVYIGKPHPMNSIAGIVAKLLRPKCRLFLDCDDIEAASNRFAGAWQSRLVRFFENWMPFQVELISSNTYFSLDRLKTLGVSEERLIYLPNGVSRERFSRISSDQVEKLRTELGMVGKKVVVYVGSLSLPSHPVDLLLQALVLLRSRIPDIRLLIVGGGEDFLTLKDQAKQMDLDEYVCFTGRVSTENVPEYYCLGNVSVDPVYDDLAAAGRAPLKMFESWAAGVPFVTMDVGDRRLLSGDPPAALLADPGNAKSLAGVLERILNQPALGNELIMTGYKRLENYYWDHILENTDWLQT